jgi:hypothetical protein
METAGPTGDLKRHATVGHSSAEIYAVSSLREIDFQQTAILEPKNARAGQFREKDLI